MALHRCGIEKSNYFISSEELTVDSGCKDFLGKGAFGKVFRCYHRDATAAVAVKMFDLTGSRDAVANTWQLARKEMEMLQFLQESPRIVNLIGVTQIDHCMLGLIMEYLPRGSLFDLVQKTDIAWPLAGRMMLETASGLSYLHRVRFDRRITHNDLKPENILFDGTFHVKLCDFGGSNLAHHSSGKLSRNQGGSDVYSINYVAPEYITSSTVTRTRAMDVYSFGMILFFVLFKRPAFHHYDSATITYFLQSGIRPKFDGQYLISSADSNQKEIIELLLHLLNICSDIDPLERPRIHTVEAELNSAMRQFDKTTLETLEHDLVRTIPILSPSLPEHRVRLQEKCKSIFVKKLQIPFDANVSEENEFKPLIYPPDRNFVDKGKVKATSSSHEIILTRSPATNDNEPYQFTTNFKGSCSTTANIITIDGDGAQLCKGGKFIIRSDTRIFTCLILDSFKKEGK